MGMKIEKKGMKKRGGKWLVIRYSNMQDPMISFLTKLKIKWFTLKNLLRFLVEQSEIK